MNMDDRDYEGIPEPEDLSKEEIAAAKRKTKVNAITMFLFFLVTAVLPYRWKPFAPLALLVPLIYRLYTRLRDASSSAPAPGVNLPQAPEMPRKEPYSYTPRDPKDPRRYKPIG